MVVHLTGFPLAYSGGGLQTKTEPLTLVLDTEPHRGNIDIGAVRMEFAWQARRFLDALQAHAPGGFVDAIFGELAMRKASVFCVADPPEKKG